MHEWWETDLPVILAALRRLRRRQRVYLIWTPSGWRNL